VYEDSPTQHPQDMSYIVWFWTAKAKRKRKIVLLELFNIYIKTKWAMIYEETLCMCACVKKSLQCF